MALSQHFPRVSPTGLYVASGALNVDIGTLALTGDGRTYAFANQVHLPLETRQPVWIADDTIFFVNNAGNDARMYTAQAPAFTPVLLVDVLSANEYAAGGGVWTVWEFGNNRVLVSTGASHLDARSSAVDTNGRYCYVTKWREATQELWVNGVGRIDSGFRIHNDSGRGPTIVPSGVVWPRIIGGRIETWGWRNAGQPVRLSQPGVNEFNPFAVETPDRTDGPWVIAHSHTVVYLRPWRSTQTYLVATGNNVLRPHAIYLSTGVNQGYFICAYGDGTPGGLRVLKIPAPGSPAPSPTPPPGTPFAVAPIGRTLHLGYFKISGRYGDFTTQATRNAGTFGVIGLGEAGSGQVPQTVMRKAAADLAALNAKAVIDVQSNSDIDIASEFWDDVLALFLSAELIASIAGNPGALGTTLQGFVQTGCTLTDSYVAGLGLAAKPLLVYYNGTQLDDPGWAVPAALDWVGLEAYYNYPTTAAQAFALSQTRLTKILGVTAKPQMLIAQAYDRRPSAWQGQGPAIGNLQPVYSDLARVNTILNGIAYFSYTRPGGTLTYAAFVRPWHEAIFRASQPGAAPPPPGEPPPVPPPPPVGPPSTPPTPPGAPPTPTPPPSSVASPTSRLRRREDLRRRRLYPHHGELKDPRVRKEVQIIFDRLHEQESKRETTNTALQKQVAAQDETIADLQAQIDELLTRDAS